MAHDEREKGLSAPRKGDSASKLRFVEESANGSIQEEEQPDAKTRAGVGAHFSDGISALRAVSRAKREHSAARSRLRELTSSIASDEELLEHRHDVEAHYQTIVSQQSAELADAQETRSQATAKIEQLNQRKGSLTAQLERMKSTHEQERRPYKNLMESSKGRADDAGSALASARRAVKAAEAQVNEATGERESRIASANRSVDGAQQRITQLTSELGQIQADPAADPAAVESLQHTLNQERINLQNAKNKVLSVTAETQDAVAEAQNRVFTCRQAVTQAEAAAEEAKAQAHKHREAYDRMAEEHRAQEAALNKEIVDCEVALREAQKDLDRAQERIEDAQFILQDAEEIHDTPETTRMLEERVASTRSTIEEQQREVDTLASQEKSVRSTTRTKRLVFFGIVAAIAVLILLIVLLATGACTPKG